MGLQKKNIIICVSSISNYEKDTSGCQFSYANEAAVAYAIK